MKKLIVALVVAAIVVGAFFLISAREGDIVLALKLKPGQVDKYRVTCKTSMQMPVVPAGAMNMSTSGLVTQKVLSVNSDGSATVETSFTEGSGHAKAASFSSSIPTPDQTFVVTVSKTGAMLDDKDRKRKLASSAGMGMMGPGPTDSLPMAPAELAGPLPERGVNVGDSWMGKVPFPLGGGDIELTSTLATDKATVGKRKVCKIQQEYKGKVDLAEIMKSVPKSLFAGMSITGEMDISGKGTVFFSREEGKVVKSRDKMKILTKMTMSGTVGPKSSSPSPGGSMSVEMTTNVDTDMDLID